MYLEQHELWCINENVFVLNQMSRVRTLDIEKILSGGSPPNKPCSAQSKFSRDFNMSVEHRMKFFKKIIFS